MERSREKEAQALRTGANLLIRSSEVATARIPRRTRGTRVDTRCVRRKRLKLDMHSRQCLRTQTDIHVCVHHDHHDIHPFGCSNRNSVFFSMTKVEDEDEGSVVEESMAQCHPTPWSFGVWMPCARTTDLPFRDKTWVRVRSHQGDFRVWSSLSKGINC